MKHALVALTLLLTTGLAAAEDADSEWDLHWHVIFYMPCRQSPIPDHVIHVATEEDCRQIAKTIDTDGQLVECRPPGLIAVRVLADCECWGGP